MKFNRRVIPLGALGILATTFIFSVPAYAWYVGSFSTTLPGSSFAIGSTIIDSANLQLSSESVPSTYNYGTITFKVYQGTCNPATGLASGTLVYTSSAVTVTSASNGASHSYSDPAGFVTTGHSAGSYYFVARYSGSTYQWIGNHYYGPYPSSTSACEPFTLLSGPPTNGVPEFPFGMAFLMALAVPILLLVRSRFARFGTPAIN